jgi:hypothetical protein
VESSGYDAAKGFASPNTQPSFRGDLTMQTDIEILETRETPMILWGWR